MGSGAHHAQEAFKAAGWSCCSAEPGCSKCIKAHLRGRRFRHLMPLAAHAGAVVPEAGQSATQGIGKHLSRHRNPCHRILPVNCGATIIWHTAWMPEQYDLTLLHPDDKLGRDIAIMRTEIEELHAKLARMPAVIARAALGIIFSDGDNHHLARVVVPSLIRLAKRPLTALCSRWLKTRRMGEDAPLP